MAEHKLVLVSGLFPCVAASIIGRWYPSASALVLVFIAGTVLGVTVGWRDKRRVLARIWWFPLSMWYSLSSVGVSMISFLTGALPN